MHLIFLLSLAMIGVLKFMLQFMVKFMVNAKVKVKVSLLGFEPCVRVFGFKGLRV